MSVNFYRKTQHHIPEDITLHCHQREMLNLKHLLLDPIFSVNNKVSVAKLLKYKILRKRVLLGHEYGYNYPSFPIAYISQEHTSGVRITQAVQCWATVWVAQVRLLAVQDCSLFHSVQTDSRDHPASYLMGTRGSFPRRKVAGV
jgi:hypothetical protein